MSDERRRAGDTRIDEIDRRLGQLEAKVDENTRLTTEASASVKAVADVLASFRVLLWLAKAVAAVGAAIVAIKHIPEWFAR